MKKLLIIILLAAVNFPAAAASIKEDTESLIREKLGDSITTEFIKYEIPKDIKKQIETESRQKFYGDFVYIYKVFQNNKFQNLVIVDNVYGKSMPITFLVIYDTSGVIYSSGIIKYREQYGGGVKSDEWNKQFNGKDDKSVYEVGKDISAISGATISVNSITRGIKKLTLLVNKIKDSL